MLAQEASTERLTQQLDGKEGQLFTALRTRTELASAFSIKARRGEVSFRKNRLSNRSRSLSN